MGSRRATLAPTRDSRIELRSLLCVVRRAVSSGCFPSQKRSFGQRDPTRYDNAAYYCAALDAGRVLSLRILRHWPGANERGYLTASLFG
jgi:hypothetical protein